MIDPKSPLLLPIHVDALVVGVDCGAGLSWSNLSPQFDRLKSVAPFADVLVDRPFAADAEALPAGVHLHFHLPSALSHGVHEGGETLDFPKLPNRWLVQRWTDGDPGMLVGWIISTDRPAFGQPGLYWPTYTEAEGQPASLQLDQTGLVQMTTDVPRTDRFPNPPDLTAIGPGHAAFSADYRASGVILGLHDPLEQLPDDAICNYVISGWFDNAADDPVGRQRSDPDALRAWLGGHGLRLTANAQRHVESGDVDGLVCHATVTGVRTGHTEPSLPSVHEVGIGATGPEALAAMIEPEEPGQILLTGLQAGLWGMPDGPETIPVDVHSRRFLGVSGGTMWGLKSASETGSEHAAARLEHLPEHLRQALDRVNAAQSAADRMNDRCRSQEKLLVSLWHKWRGAPQNDVSNWGTKFRDLRTALSFARHNDEPLLQEALKTAMDALTDALAHYSTPSVDNKCTDKGPSRYKLVSASAPAFFGPSEPSVAIMGTPAARRNTRDLAADILCRTLDDLVAEIRVETPDGNIESAARSGFLDWAFPGSGHLKMTNAVAQGLLGEATLMADQSADMIVAYLTRDYMHAPAADVRAAMVQGVRAVQAAHVQMPNLGAAEWVFEWQGNPWRPLYMLWQVGWSPTVIGAEDEAPALGEMGEVKLPATEATEPEQILTGSALLSDSMPRRFAGLLEAHSLQHSPLADKLADETLVQTLTGFNAALFQKRPVSGIRPLRPGSLSEDPEMAGVWRNQAALTELPDATSKGAFSPVRAGRLRVQQLAIVDAFGRTHNVFDSTSADCPTLSSAHSVSGSSHPQEAFLRPRLSAPARLSTRWLSQASDAQPGNAIFGWMLPNLLDHSYSIYDAQGQLQGILLRRLDQIAGDGDDAAGSFQWMQDPSSPEAVPVTDAASPTQIETVNLKALCDWFQHLNADAVARFASLIQTNIEWTDSRAAHDALEIAPLIGRPLALVAAEFAIESQGYPPHATDLLPHTGAPIEKRLVTNGVTQSRWPLRLGDTRQADNGVIGAFVLDNSGMPDIGRGFFPAWTGKDEKPTYRNATFPVQDLSVSMSQPLCVALLVDPAATIHVSTGILPRLRLTLPEVEMASVGTLKRLFFEVAPVLGSSDRQSLTVPAAEFGRWSWLVSGLKSTVFDQKPGGGFGVQEIVATEGWLQLEPLRLIRGFAPRQQARNVPRNSKIILEWLLDEVETVELWVEVGDTAPERIATWDAPEIPQSHEVTILQEAVFKLVAKTDDHTDRAEIGFGISQGLNAS